MPQVYRHVIVSHTGNENSFYCTDEKKWKKESHNWVGVKKKCLGKIVYSKCLKRVWGKSFDNICSAINITC